jgi:hypothetical protein
MLNLGRLPHRSPSLHTEAGGSAIPDAFGPFRVLHQIGAGTLGPVFRAYDAERERLVAVKLFRLDLPPEKVHQLVTAFEQLIATELTHPALATPLATGMVGVQAYLAMDYAPAESLDLAVREYGPAPPADALRVAAQLAGGLDFAAVVHVVHGCLHPRDVLLAADDTRVTGIGIARALEGVGVMAPTRRPYTAPERAAGQAWDRRADIFTLAALTHELLWGRRIAGHGLAEGLPNPPGGDVESLRDVFARALAEDPHDRFGTALEFADALRSAFPAIGDAKAEAGPAAAPIAAPIVMAPQLPLEDPAPSNVVPMEIPIEAPIAAPVAASDAVELELRKEADPEIAERYRDVAPPPAVVATPVASPVSFGSAPAFESESTPPPRSRAGLALAAVAAALIVGLAVGYGVGMRGGAPQVEQTPIADASPAAAPAAAPPAREATEVAVTEPAKPAPGPSTAAPTPVDRTPEPRESRPASPARRPSTSSRAATPAPRVAERRTTVPPPPQPASGTAGRYVGRLSVDSRPDGARVFLDGREVGRTPLEVATVSAGEHAIRLERDGYRRWSSAIRVVASERTRVTASLER